MFVELAFPLPEVNEREPFLTRSIDFYAKGKREQRKYRLGIMLDFIPNYQTGNYDKMCGRHSGLGNERINISYHN